MNDREKWRERESGIFVLAAWHDDDDDIRYHPKVSTAQTFFNKKLISFKQNTQGWYHFQYNIIQSKRMLLGIFITKHSELKLLLWEIYLEIW